LKKTNMREHIKQRNHQSAQIDEDGVAFIH